MAVFRVEKNKGYTVMSNYHLKDKTLTLKSKGLLSMILSLPENWNYTTRGLAKICMEGVDCIGGCLRELEKAGYIIRNRLRDSKGRITDTEYVIYEQPVAKPDTAAPCTENPYMDAPDTVAPHTEMPSQYITKQVSTKKSNTVESTIHQSITNTPTVPKPVENPIDRIDEIETYRDLIKDNIEYGFLARQYDRDRVDEVVELMLETVMSSRDYIRVASDSFPKEVVKNRLLKLNYSHIEYVFDCINKNTTKVHNIKAYLLSALYNAPATMDSYYRVEVNHDMYGGRI